MSCRVGITLGDQAGIGPEIVHAALASGRLPADAEYSVIGPAIDCSLGQPTAETARAAWDALEEAARLALRGELDASSSASQRSEEHTSELQSRFDLVCRLLLEKKKKKKTTQTNSPRTTKNTQQ